MEMNLVKKPFYLMTIDKVPSHQKLAAKNHDEVGQNDPKTSKEHHNGVFSCFHLFVSQLH